MRARQEHPVRVAWLIVVGLVALLLTLGGCGNSGEGNDTLSAAFLAAKKKELKEVGTTESDLDLIAAPGFIEPQWSAPFKAATGCKVTAKVATTSNQMVELMKTGKYDGIAAPSNISARLIEAGEVTPINVSVLPNYKTIYPDLKKQSFDSFEGVPYGMPQSRRANLMIWNDSVSPSPKSWSAIFDPAEAATHKGAISIYESPMYIADAALYLMRHEPTLGIEDPYELDEEQFDATVKLLEELAPNVGEYWSIGDEQIAGFEESPFQVGTTWQFQLSVLKVRHKPVQSNSAAQGYLPEEGTTGLVNTWMVSSKAKHPNCMYFWLNWVAEPKYSAEISEFLYQSPAQSAACKETKRPKFCAEYHAEDAAFWKRVFYWQEPKSECANGDDDCVPFDEWAEAWDKLKE